MFLKNKAINLMPLLIIYNIFGMEKQEPDKNEISELKEVIDNNNNDDLDKQTKFIYRILMLSNEIKKNKKQEDTFLSRMNQKEAASEITALSLFMKWLNNETKWTYFEALNKVIVNDLQIGEYSDNQLLESLQKLDFKIYENDTQSKIEEKKNKNLFIDNQKKILLKNIIEYYGTLDDHTKFDVNTLIPMAKDNSYYSSYVGVVDNKKVETFLHKAVLSNNISWVEYLIKDLKANINAKNSRGETPLLYAIKESKYDIAKKLLEFKADPNINNDKTNENLETPLGQAIYSQKFELINLLEYYGAKS